MTNVQMTNDQWNKPQSAGSSLVIGHWSLVIGHWSLVIGHWSLVIGHWSFFCTEVPATDAVGRRPCRPGSRTQTSVASLRLPTNQPTRSKSGHYDRRRLVRGKGRVIVRC